MKTLDSALEVLAAISGFIAAWYWYQASRVNPSPWSEDNPAPATMNPIVGSMMWTGATADAIKKSGELNSKASIWTALAVGLGAIATLVGIWS
ncbi:hypothetical protein SAMN05444161_7515 [Rhizobiales bacterium GAS191]|nr:hypothetical protein SAMN05444161_7515 [Rhizobiales bacterium GAS191]